MKVISWDTSCPCQICQRSHTHSTKSSATTPKSHPISLCLRTPLSQSSDPTPTASTSQPLYCPALLLPNELLSLIFTSSRPPLPTPTEELIPVSSEYTSFVRLPTVCSAWRATAQRELGRSFVFRRYSQLEKVVEALERGWIDKDLVGEITLDLKDISGAEEVGEERTTEALRRILTLCSRFHSIRVTGFGVGQLQNPSFWKSRESPLVSLTTLEYTPQDSTEINDIALITWFAFNRRLKNLVIEPSSVTHCSFGRDDLYEKLGEITCHLDFGHLSSLKITSTILYIPHSFTLFAAMTNLTEFHLHQCHLLDSPDQFLTFFRSVGPQLLKLSIEAPYSKRNLFLSSSHIWEALETATNLVDLRLFGHFVFDSFARPDTYVLPFHLEQLVIGAVDMTLLTLQPWISLTSSLADRRKVLGMIEEELILRVRTEMDVVRDVTDDIHKVRNGRVKGEKGGTGEKGTVRLVWSPFRLVEWDGLERTREMRISWGARE